MLHTLTVFSKTLVSTQEQSVSHARALASANMAQQVGTI